MIRPKYDSMPSSAVATGVVDFVLTPENIAKELARIAAAILMSPGSLRTPPPAEDDRAAATAHANDDTPLPSGGRGRRERTRPRGAENGCEKILLLLRNHSGVDFSLYKLHDLQRRITRRMVLNKKIRKSTPIFSRATPRNWTPSTPTCSSA